MSDHYQYLDSFYRSSYPGGGSVDSGSTNFQYGFPASLGFGHPVASTSSTSTTVSPSSTSTMASSSLACTKASSSSASAFTGPSQMPSHVVRFVL